MIESTQPDPRLALQAFADAIGRSGRQLVSCSIAFFERRRRSGAFAFLRAEERVVWERWGILLRVTQGEEVGSSMPSPSPTALAARERRRAALESSLQERQLAIITAAGSRRDHIPPADGLGAGTDELPWFEITSPSIEPTWQAQGLDMVKNLLSSPPTLPKPG